MLTRLFLFGSITEAEEEETDATNEDEDLQRRFPNQFIPTSAFVDSGEEKGRISSMNTKDLTIAGMKVDTQTTSHPPPPVAESDPHLQAQVKQKQQEASGMSSSAVEAGEEMYDEQNYEDDFVERAKTEDTAPRREIEEVKSTERVSVKEINDRNEVEEENLKADVLKTIMIKLLEHDQELHALREELAASKTRESELFQTVLQLRDTIKKLKAHVTNHD
jgi:hypothetical protein